MTTRVLIVLKTNQGGAWILPHIDALQRRGMFVTVLIPKGPGRLRAALDARNIDVLESAFDFSFRPTLRLLKGLFALRQQIASLQPDVVMYHLYASALASRLSTVGLKIPRVHMVAGPLYLESPLIRAFEKFLLRLDTVLIAGSEYTASEYRRLGIRPAALRSINYGVDTAKFVPDTADTRAQTRASLGVPRQNFLAVMVAYVYAPKDLVHAGVGIKGHDVLLAAWNQFVKAHPQSTLLIVGAGFDESGERHRQKLIAEFDATSINVMWLDTVDDVRPLYWAADVSVSPSLSENHGAAVEASACGVPCIVSDAGGLPEAVNGQSGWVTAKGAVPALVEALETAWSEFDAGLLHQRGSAARHLMEQEFSSSSLADDVADVVMAAAEGPANLPSIPPVTFFSEARFGLNASRQAAARDEASSGAVWAKYAASIPGFRVAARLERNAGTAFRSLDGIDVVGLPYYLGLRQLIFAIPRTIQVVFKSVKESSAVVVRLPGAIGFSAVMAAVVLRRPVYVEVVGDPREVLSVSGSRVGGLMSGPVAVVMRFCVAKGRAVRYVTARYLQEKYPPHQKAVAFSISDVDISPDDFSNPSPRNKPEVWHLGCVGSQERDYKGHDIAIRALATLRSQGLEARLSLVGRGIHQGNLRKLAKSLDVEHRVAFIDSIDDRGQLNSFYDDLDILLHPSRTEGLPRVIIEAMARSRPVVASDVGGIAELVDDAWLVPKNDVDSLARKIATMTRLPASERMKISASNLEVATKFSSSVSHKEFMRFCAQVAEKGDK